MRALRDTFAQLHVAGTFVMPNAWDIGSARILAALGFPAIATTSSGHAASLGRPDQHVTLEELLDHASALVVAVGVPLSIDAERCFADTPGEVIDVVHQLAETGAAGLSIEDFDPSSGIEPLGVAVQRVTAAAEAARAHGMVLTARAEDYRDAGAGCVYAPGTDRTRSHRPDRGRDRRPRDRADPSHRTTVPDLAELGVRRVSTGGALAFAAYGTLASAARELLSTGTSTYTEGSLTAEDRRTAFTDPPRAQA